MSQQTSQKRKWGRIAARIGLGLLAALAVALVGFILWATMTPAVMPEAIAALESDAAVTVTGSNPIAFAPTSGATKCGFIFYQGGRVDERSYAPALRAIADAGYLVLTPSMPLNLAVLAPNRAGELIAAHPEITRWVIGGHSLGGAMAASFAHGNSSAVSGIALWASFPAGGSSLAGAPLAAASIYGTLDGLATPADIEASRALLPPTTTFVPIEGGNHAQFGWYGDQRGDNPARITRLEQQEQTVAATLALLRATCQAGS